MDKNIVIYNNNTDVVAVLRPLLMGENIRLLVAEDDVRLRRLLQEEQVHLLITDVVWPGREQDITEGLEALQWIRQQSSLPIIVVSARDDETSKILALNAGADDYVVSGCNPLELLARIKSQLRRYTQLVNMCANINKIYQVDGLVIDDNTRRVSVDQKEVRLTPIEYKILKLLVQERGKVLSISQIYEAIWHMQAIGADNTIAVHIRHIREKIEQNPKEPRYLKVVWGTGYKVG
ncbi:MAG: response regulator transcription factor [Lachnospiraceae bacterium]|nr:response regulator transcription factor [Lachnospiraceae bacterium]